MFATVTFSNGQAGHFEGDDLAETVETAAGALLGLAVQYDPTDEEHTLTGDIETADGLTLTWTAVAIDNPCTQCGAPTVGRERTGRTRGEETEYWIDDVCTNPACGYVNVDTEGGV